MCRPWEKQRKFTNKRVAITLILLFLFSTLLFLYFPLSLRISSVKTPNKDLNLTETFYNECQIYHVKTYSFFGIISVLLVYVVPFFILAILNIMIIIKLRLRPFQSKFVSHKKPSQSYQNEIGDPNTNTGFVYQVVQFNQSKNDRNLSITLVTVAVTFMMLTFPFQAFWFYENFYKQFASNNSNLTNETLHTIEKYFKDTTFSIKNMNYLINFFLYSALSKLFRQEFLALFSSEKINIRRKCEKDMVKKKGRNKKKSGEVEKCNSTFAELSFSMEAFKSLKNGNIKNNAKLLRIRVEPSNFLKYFQIGRLNYEIEVAKSDDFVDKKNESNETSNEQNESAEDKSINKCCKSSSTQAVRTTIKQYKMQERPSSGKKEHDSFASVLEATIIKSVNKRCTDL